MNEWEWQRNSFTACCWGHRDASNFLSCGYTSDLLPSSCFCVAMARPWIQTSFSNEDNLMHPRCLCRASEFHRITPRLAHYSDRHMSKAQKGPKSLFASIRAARAEEMRKSTSSTSGRHTMETPSSYRPGIL